MPQADRTPIGMEIIAKTKSDSHSRLSVLLMQEKRRGVDSFFYPYINILPEVFTNVPINFGPELLSMLKGSMAIRTIDKKKAEIRAAYDVVNEAVEDFDFTYEEFAWARTVVITRLWVMDIKGEKTETLVPMDVLNHWHSDEVKTTWGYDNDMQGFKLQTRPHKTMKRGEDLHISYGQKDQSRFFVNYGFALDGNQIDNEAVIKLKAAGSVREFQVGVMFDGDKTSSAFAFARRAFAAGSETPPDPGAISAE
eukprot:918953_1